MESNALKSIFASAEEIAKICSEKQKRIALRYGLTCMEAKILRELAIKKKAKKSDLLKNFDFTSGRMTHLLISLQKKGFVYRENCKEDSREIIIKITSKGKKIATRIIQNCEEFYEETSKILKNASYDSIAVVLENLKDEIKALTQTREEK